MKNPLLYCCGRPVVLVGLFLLVGSAAAQPQEPAAAERLMLEADRLLESGDIDGALRDYQMLVERFPESSLAPRALLKVALERKRGGDGAGARATAEEIIGRFPRSEAAAGAAFVVGEIQARAARSAADLELAQTTLRNVWVRFGRQDFPVLPWRAAARVKSAELRLARGHSQRAAAILLAAIEQEAPSEWMPRARIALAEIFLLEGEIVAAAEILQRVADKLAHSEDSVEYRTARDRLSLIHRLALRARSAHGPWRQAELLCAPGLSLRKPSGLAAHADGRLAITYPGSNRIVVLDAGYGEAKSSPKKNVQRPTWDAQGRLYVGVDDHIALPLSKERQSFVKPGSNKQAPLESIVATERGVFGEWLVLTRKPKQVLVFEADGSFRKSLLPARESDAVDLVVDAINRIYILDGDAKRVVRFDAENGTAETLISGTWKNAQALAIDQLGNLYVLDRDQRQVHVFDRAGKSIATLGPLLPDGIELREPQDLAVDGRGRLLIADAKLPGIVVLK